MSNRNGVARELLKGELDTNIEHLNAAVLTPDVDDPACSTRKPVLEGLLILLKIEKVKMEGDIEIENSLKIGNVTITGTVATLSACVVYVMLKLHGLI